METTVSARVEGDRIGGKVPPLKELAEKEEGAETELLSADEKKYDSDDGGFSPETFSSLRRCNGAKEMVNFNLLPIFVGTPRNHH